MLYGYPRKIKSLLMKG